MESLYALFAGALGEKAVGGELRKAGGEEAGLGKTVLRDHPAQSRA